MRRNSNASMRVLLLALVTVGSAGVSVGQPTLTPIQTLSPGESIVVRGDTALVGSHERVSEYRMEGGRWTEASRVRGPAGVGFPSGMDFDPSTGSAFVGAYADPEFGSYSGSIYEFHLGNPWTFVSRIVHPDSVSGLMFGAIFRLIGDQLVVASRCTGALHVMDKKDGQWFESQRLTTPGCVFLGEALHWDGALAVTQAGVWDGQQVTYTPRIVKKVDSLWTDVNPLPALAGFDGDLPMDSFGSTWIVGADAYNDGYGTVYVFERAGSSLQFRGRLDAWDGDCGQSRCRFGRAVAIGEHFAAVLRGLGSYATIYVFQKAHGSWVASARLLSPRGMYFGEKMAIHDDYLSVSSEAGIHLYDLSVLLTSVDGEAFQASLTLSQNHPNPFMAKTNIAFSLPVAGQVRMIVYDMLGRQIDQLLENTLPAGHHEITWDVSGLPAGAYLYRLTSPSGTRTGIALRLK